MSKRDLSRLEALRKSANLDLVINVDPKGNNIPVDTLDFHKGQLIHYIDLM